jgi:hypothetical protein
MAINPNIEYCKEAFQIRYRNAGLNPRAHPFASNKDLLVCVDLSNPKNLVD